MEKIQGFPDLSQPPARGHARICKPHLGSGLHFVQHGKKVYVATVIDLYTRRIGNPAAALTIQALSNALINSTPAGVHEILDGCAS